MTPNTTGLALDIATIEMIKARPAAGINLCSSTDYNDMKLQIRATEQSQSLDTCKRTDFSQGSNSVKKSLE